jgi:polyphosphate kinase
VAPRDLRNQLVDLIEHEMTFGTTGRITAKMNSLADPQMIDALYRASEAGVQIDLIVRGLCCLGPACRGSARTSGCARILGRYLEHSRIVRFEHGRRRRRAAVPHRQRRLDGPQPRRSRRGAVPVVHPKHRDWLDQVFEFDMADDIVRHELDADRPWHRRGPAVFSQGDAQERFNRWVNDRQTDLPVHGLVREPFGRCSPLVHLSDRGVSPWLFTVRGVDTTPTQENNT